MASAAPKMEAGVDIPGEEEQVEQQTGPRDFETEAREHGWVPEDEFKGDKARWVDAETFMKRADEMMPLLKATNARQKREIEQLKKDLKRFSSHMEGVEKRAYERAMADLEAKHTQAVEAGDVKAAAEAVKEMRDLKPAAEAGYGADKSPEEVRAEAEEALDAFRESNPWYDRANLANADEVSINARLYFDRMIDKHIAQTKHMAPADFFSFIDGLTKEKYPQLTNKTPRAKPLSPVEGATAGRGRGASKSWDNLPDAAKRQYERFINRGLLGVKSTGDKEKDLAASRAYYAKTHDWEGFQA